MEKLNFIWMKKIGKAEIIPKNKFINRGALLCITNGFKQFY